MPPNLFKHLIITVILSTAVALALLSFVSLTPARAGGRKARLVFRTNQASIKYTDVPAIESAEWRPWLHKSGIRVAAIVFYGRRKYVRVLDKYLKRNTWSAGGILGEVHWIVRTDDAQDLHWLNHVLIPSEPSYRKLVVQGTGFESHYKQLSSQTYYLKLDDDIVFIKDKAVDAMLHAKLMNRFWIVSANVINHSILTWVHAAMGALDTQYPTSAGMAQTGAYTDEIKALLQQLPFAEMHYDIFDKCSWSSAQCAAVTQYMFLESVIHNTTDKYDFNLWDFHAFDYRRWSINTILFKGSDLNSEHIAPDDEQSISVDLPRAKGQHCGAVGQALVVHLAYYPQRDNGADKLLSAFEQLACKFTGDLLPDVAA